MSDVIDDEERFFGRQLLQKSRLGPLRERMQEFVSEHRGGDVKTVRERLSKGETDLSDLVAEEREERL